MRKDRGEGLKIILFTFLIMSIATLACGIPDGSPAAQAVKPELIDQYTTVTLPQGVGTYSVWSQCAPNMDYGQFNKINGIDSSGLAQIGQQIQVPIDTPCSTTSRYVQALKTHCTIQTFTNGNQENLYDVANASGFDPTAAGALSGTSGNFCVPVITYAVNCQGMNVSDSLQAP